MYIMNLGSLSSNTKLILRINILKYVCINLLHLMILKKIIFTCSKNQYTAKRNYNPTATIVSYSYVEVLHFNYIKSKPVHIFTPF